MRTVRLIALALAGVVPNCVELRAVQVDAATVVDSDHDGLSDALEQELLARFAPSFQVDPQDCAGRPAFFLPDSASPVVGSEDGTIYAEASPRVLPNLKAPVVELRYFHLWRSDCGRMAHALDAEHVSVLIEGGPGSAEDAGGWRALYWYAAAHEDTVCDASQITRASTLDAVNRGALVWISRGKHASFLNKELCERGCGGDDCRATQTLAVSRIVNLGEAKWPMNGSIWTGSAEWQLAAKLARSDFEPEVLARLEQLPASDIAWVYPSKRPAQATIAAGGSTADALAMSNRKTDTAISLASDKTGNALDVSYGKVVQSLRKSAANVGRFLNGGHGPKAEPGGSLTKDGKF
jgi:hypothetical protein